MYRGNKFMKKVNTQKIYTPYFLHEGHQYHTPEGRRLDSVTTILKEELGLYQYGQIGAATRGTYVHQLCEDLDQGNITDADEATISVELLPYFYAYKLAKAEVGFKVLACEKRLYHPVYLYAGTLDRIVEMDNEIVLDIKTGKKEPWHGMQLSAYEEMAHVSMPLSKAQRRGRVALYLHNDGTYDLEHYENPHDWRNFLALYSAHNVKIELGYRKIKNKETH